MLSYHFDLLMLKKLFENISPPKFYAFSCIIIPWSFAVSLLLIFYGIYQGLFVVPPDYQQGEAFRIIYVHVPSAWLSLLAYSVLFVTSIISLIWKIKVFEVITISSAKIGALFTFLALVTGSIWGKPMWGTWWVWDARLTSELILFFVYLSIIFLYGAFDDVRKGSKAASILAIIGFVNIPIIHFSVEWWNTLHQPASILRTGGISINNELLLPLFLMAVGFMLTFIYTLLISVEIKLKEK